MVDPVKIHVINDLDMADLPGIPLSAGDAKVKVDHRRQVLPLTDGFSSWPGLRSTSVPKRISACDQTCSYAQQVARNWVAAQCLEDKYNQCQIHFSLSLNLYYHDG